MQFIRSHGSSMNLSKLSYLRANHKYPPCISASLGVIRDPHAKSGGFRAKPTSGLSQRCSMNNFQGYPTRVSASLGNIRDSHSRFSQNQEPLSRFSPGYAQNNGLMNVRYGSIGLPVGFRSYSSFFGNKGDGSLAKGLADNADGADGLKKAWQSIVDAADLTAQKARDASDAITPHVQMLLDTHPYLKNVVIPAGWTLTGTLLAWLVMPRVLRKLHQYATQSSVALLHGNVPPEPIPYEKSLWGSLEDPVRYLVTFMAISQLGTMIAPTAVASQYVAQACKGAFILSLVWFVHRWKTNVFTHMLSQNIMAVDRERMVALDRFSSVGIFLLGSMALAEAYGVAVQSILTVGGIGGVATAFAARDILMNVLSGLFMQFSKPFSLGDTIRAGSIDGKVVAMGLTSTTLLNAEKFPVSVPNSLFLSQAIVNKSRAQWLAMVTTIPIRIDKVEKVPQISNGIEAMLKSNSNIFLGEEVPYCVLTGIESLYGQLTIGCNLKPMSKYELRAAEQDIKMQAFQIIKDHDASVGVTA